jgi:hypothetical protein
MTKKMRHFAYMNWIHEAVGMGCDGQRGVAKETMDEEVMTIEPSARLQAVGWIWFAEVRRGMGRMRRSLSL